MFEFRKLASRLARDTKDSSDDKSLDLDIAQASHAIKVMKKIAKQDPDLIKKALKLSIPTPKDERLSKESPSLPVILDFPDRFKAPNSRTPKSPDNTKKSKRKLTTAFYRAFR